MRRVLLISLALTIALGLLAGLHVYLANRLVIEPGWPEPWRSLALVGITAGGILIFLEPIAQRRIARSRALVVAWPATLWMGFAFLAIMLVAASDLAWSLVGAASAAQGSGVGDAVGPARSRAFAVAAVTLLAGAAALRQGLRPPTLRRVEIPLAGWPRELDGFRLAQISDIHIGPLLDRRFAQHLVDRVNALDADLVAVTGDLVDGSVARLADEVAPFAGLRARHGAFFVTGNHDHLSGARSWSEHVASLGLRVLRNEHVTLEHDGAVFDVAGVDDHRGSLEGGEGGEDLERALADRDPSRPVLLLAHDPSTFKRAKDFGVDLQISGHTHGGQIWPFGGIVRLVIPFVAGRYRRGRSELYVSRGSGFWGPPMRLFAPAEITEITLRSGVEA